jgi:hypothetical protein
MNNPYGLPPLGTGSGAAVNHMYYPHQQQHQSERISGDGEEVHRYGYLRPGGNNAQQVAPIAPPPLGTPTSVGGGGPPVPPPQSQSQSAVPQQQQIPGLMYNNNTYDPYNQAGSMLNNQMMNQYDPYGQPSVSSAAFQPSAQTNGSQETVESYAFTDNRSADGEEQNQQMRYGNDPSGVLQQPQNLYGSGDGVANNLDTAGGPPPPSTQLNYAPQTSSPNSNIPSNSIYMPMMESYEPVGLENVPQQYLLMPQPEERCETIGSAEREDVLLPPPPNNSTVGQEEFRATGAGGSGPGTEYGYDLEDQSENDPRSVDGQEYPDLDNTVPSNNQAPPSVSSSSSGVGTALSTEHRSQTIGSETQADNESRSIEGQEQAPSHPGGSVISNNISSNPPLSSGATSSITRSETLGSDSIHDEQRLPLSSKSTLPKHHNAPSGSETGDSTGRGAGGGREKDSSSRRVVDSDEEKRRSLKVRRGDTHERRRYIRVYHK